MITEAIDKITAEVNKNKGDMAQVLGEYLIDNMNEAWAEKIIVNDKTLDGAIKSMTDKARAKQFGGTAVIKDDVAFGWLREYYGLTEVSNRPEPEVKRDAQIVTSMTGLHVDLSDLF